MCPMKAMPRLPGPYRYQEMLGVIWRENPCRWLKPDESPILMATLMECDENNQPLIGAYIDRSGLDAETGSRSCSEW